MKSIFPEMTTKSKMIKLILEITRNNLFKSKKSERIQKTEMYNCGKNWAITIKLQLLLSYFFNYNYNYNYTSKKIKTITITIRFELLLNYL